MTELTKAEKLANAAETVADIAAAFAPVEAATVKNLIAAGRKLNDLYHQVLGQVEAENPEVWAEVRSDYQDAVAAFKASVERSAQ